MSTDSRDPDSVGWRASFQTALRLLFFRASQSELIQLGWRHLAIGVICTWLVGVGRYWDNPRAGLLQHLGVGSVIYIMESSPNDSSYGSLLVLSWLSMLLFNPLAICYLAMTASRFWVFKDEDAGLLKDTRNG